MVLPSLIHSEEYKLILEVPETTTLEILNVSGQITHGDGNPVKEPLLATLRLPNASVLEPVSVDKDGRFFFGEVELREDQANKFSLTIKQTPGGAEVASDLQLTQQRIAPADYPRFREFLRQVDEALEQSFEVVSER